MSTIALRPYLPTDTRVLADIARDAIEQLAGEDYSDAQRAVWSAGYDDEADFAQRLGSQLTLVATIGGAAVGFASLAGKNHIDLLYVEPRAARRGVATMLVDALEKLAAARGAARLTVDASDTAKPLFDARGYAAERRNSVPLGDEWLANTTMRKDLEKRPAPKGVS
jgi:putative acetyltransferase